MDMVDSALERPDVALSKHGMIVIFFDPTVGPYAIEIAGPWGEYTVHRHLKI